MRTNEGRTVGLFTKVSPEEKAAIDRRMELLGTSNLRAYLRKMAVDGYVVRVDMTDVKELAALLRTCSNNLNQIAQKAHVLNVIDAPRYDAAVRQFEKVVRDITEAVILPRQMV